MVIGLSRIPAAIAAAPAFARSGLALGGAAH